MKKNLFYLLALICSVSLFSSCSDDDESPYAKTYGLSTYTTGKLIVNGETLENAVLSGAGYVNYACMVDDTDWGTSYGMVFRGIFGVLLPQVLKTVTLEADGNITAEYIPSPNITFDPMWALMAPTADVVKGLIPGNGWTKSPKGLATWSEKSGKIYVKLNISSILAQVLGGDAKDLEGIITGVLNGSPAQLKIILAGLLNVDQINISDETIAQLQSWVNNGFPLTAKTVDGHTYMYLDKTAFDNLMKMRVQPDGSESSDILVLWQLLVDAEIVPKEAEMAGMLVGGISMNWAKATAFELGLDLQLNK